MYNTVSVLNRVLFKNIFYRNSYANFGTSNIMEMVKHQESRSAGIIIIGDEVLKGQVHDTNSYFIAKILYKLGVKVDKISVVSDVEAKIASEVKDFSDRYTYVITTGGIGPTHDDITYQSVAKAFDVPLIPHPDLVKLTSDYYKTDDLKSPAMKMAHIPSSAKLTYGFDEAKGKKMLYPNVSVKNVYMFPGIPQLTEKLFSALSQDLFGGGTRTFFMKELYLTARENTIANTLSSILTECPNVTIGSYPKFFHSYYKVLVTVESEVEEDMKEAYDKLKIALAQDVIEYDKNPEEEAYKKLQNLMKSSNNAVLMQAVDVIKDCLQKFSSEDVYIYFDGGIEATCVLHIYHAISQKDDSTINPKAICIKEECHTPELNSFVNETISRYKIKFEVFDSNSRSSFTNPEPGTKVIILGNLTSENKADYDLRSLEENTTYSNIRWVTPLIDWKITDVWNFSRSLTLPYCTLYDQGHTTLGSTKTLLSAIAEMNRAG